ncbi:MAG: hypothetical protein WEB63_05270 [Cucumibacter sp.]
MCTEGGGLDAIADEFQAVIASAVASAIRYTAFIAIIADRLISAGARRTKLKLGLA